MNHPFRLRCRCRLLSLSAITLLAWTGSSISLRATFAPGSDAFANAPEIPSEMLKDESSVTDTTHYSREPNESVFTYGEHTAWWKWTAPKDGWVTFDTQSDSALGGLAMVDTFLAVFSSSTLPSPQLVEVNARADYGTQRSSVTFLAKANTTYRIQIDGGTPTLHGHAISPTRSGRVTGLP